MSQVRSLSGPLTMVRLTSDPHWYHRNIITYCDRPFLTLDGHPDVELMNETLIQNWNAVVGAADTTYLLGDIGFCGREAMAALRRRLNGYIIVILGNHDRSAQFLLQCGFDEVYKQPLKIGRAALSHQPLTKGEWEVNIHGHVHEKWATKDYKWYNVGVDVRGFRPVTLEELGLDPHDYALPARGPQAADC